jgi:hypothetical protein
MPRTFVVVNLVCLKVKLRPVALGYHLENFESSCGLGFRTLERESHHSTLFQKQSLDNGDGMPARKSQGHPLGLLVWKLVDPSRRPPVHSTVNICPSFVLRNTTFFIRNVASRNNPPLCSCDIESGADERLCRLNHFLFYIYLHFASFRQTTTF